MVAFVGTDTLEQFSRQFWVLMGSPNIWEKWLARPLTLFYIFAGAISPGTIEILLYYQHNEVNKKKVEHAFIFNIQGYFKFLNDWINCPVWYFSRLTKRM